MSESTLDPAIKGLECKHVCYTTAKDGSAHDLLVVKENIHYHDGRVVPNLRFIVDFKRPFYIDRAAFAPPGSHGTYKDKKEWQQQTKLQRFTCTQVDLPNSIFRAVNPGRVPTRPQRLREVCRSPYVYGADVTTPVLVKRHYMDKWPQCNGVHGTPMTVCNLDTETDMVKGTGDIVMTSLAMDKRVRLYVTEDFLRSVRDPINNIHVAFEHYLGEVKKRREIDLQVVIVKDAADSALQALKQIHEWKPDIVAIWNMNFDIKKMMSVIERAGLDLGEAFSDPSVPPVFKKFQYQEGASTKVTQSGKTMPLPPFDQWHTLSVPASYQVIDAMCLYRKLRFAKGMENGYGLDAVLKRNECGGKLKFKEADHLTGAQWHAFMQKNYPVEYCIYNCWDTISMQELDEKTGDICRQLGLHSGHSEFSKFPSQPRRTWDDLHFECLERGLVAATTSDQMRVEMDAKTTPLTGWIVTLPSHQVKDTGMQILEEIPDFSTMVWSHVADLDITATYPTGECIANISRETTVCELVAIEGLDDRTQRSVGINLTGGHVNAAEICTRVFKAPTFDVLLSDYLKIKGIETNITELGWVDDLSGDAIAEEEGEEEEAY
jgi:hypothetical protein